MPVARPLLLALALEAAPLGVVRLARPAWRRSAYVATLVVSREKAEGQCSTLTGADLQGATGDSDARGD